MTLKIKSAGTISFISPILAMLQGCDTDWPIIISDGSVTMGDEPTTMVTYHDICTYSLGRISMQTSANVRGRMITNLINICQIEAVVKISASEFHHLLIICMVIMCVHIPANYGIQLQTNGDSDHLTCLSHAPGCYCDPSKQDNSPVYVNATSLIECAALGCYSQVRSLTIRHN